MYRTYAFAMFGVSFLLLITDASMAAALPATALASASGLLVSLPSALAVIFAAIGRKLLGFRSALSEISPEDHYAPLTRMINVFEIKDQHEPLTACL